MRNMRFVFISGESFHKLFFYQVCVSLCQNMTCVNRFSSGSSFRSVTKPNQINQTKPNFFSNEIPLIVQFFYNNNKPMILLVLRKWLNSPFKNTAAVKILYCTVAVLSFSYKAILETVIRLLSPSLSNEIFWYFMCILVFLLAGVVLI